MYNYELQINYDNDEEYKNCFLKVFNTNDIDKSGKNRKELYSILNKIDVFNDLFKYTSPPYLSPFTDENNDDDNEWGMIMLFSYDYFKFFHKCIQLYFKDNKITQDLINKINGLKKIIQCG